MKFRSHLSAFLIALFSVIAVAISVAQTPTGPIVKEISIQYAGPASVSRERILANMRTAIGKPYSDQAVEEDIRNLYSTGNITNVRIFGEPVKDGVKVVVVVQTKATVGEVIINGITQLRVNRVRKDLSVKPGDTLNEANLEQDRQKILDDYEKKGYTDTDVKYDVETNDISGKARVTFTVTEGGKTAVTSVRFEGNTTFTSKELRKVVKTKPKNILS